MAREPQRAAEPHHLDARLVPVELALKERAKELKAMADSEAALNTDPAEARFMARMATEFTALAAELHHW